MDTHNLEAAGLTKVEAHVYSVLLDLGSAQAGEISRKSGVHRRSVYDVMERLIEKGLVAYIKLNDRRVFQATSPTRLLELVDEKKKNIEKIIPQLILKYKLAKQKQETIFYRGKEGIRTIFEDQIEEGKDVLVIGGASDAKKFLNYFIDRYTKKRVEKKIKLKIIYCSTKKQKEMIPLAEIKYLPETYASAASTNVYGDKVAIILWTENPFAILINDKEIAKSYKNYFELLWQIAK